MQTLESNNSISQIKINEIVINLYKCICHYHEVQS